MFVYLLGYMFFLFMFHGLQRLSNLRIHEDFNSALCRAVTKACVRAGAIDFGKCCITSLGRTGYLKWITKNYISIDCRISYNKIFLSFSLAYHAFMLYLVYFEYKKEKNKK